MSKLYIARHKRYDMYWGRKEGVEMWTNDISAALLMTKPMWLEKFGEQIEDITLYKREEQKT